MWGIHEINWNSDFLSNMKTSGPWSVRTNASLLWVLLLLLQKFSSHMNDPSVSKHVCLYLTECSQHLHKEVWDRSDGYNFSKRGKWVLLSWNCFPKFPPQVRDRARILTLYFVSSLNIHVHLQSASIWSLWVLVYAEGINRSKRDGLCPQEVSIVPWHMGRSV
jgi:hypothetical protein